MKTDNKCIVFIQVRCRIKKSLLFSRQRHVAVRVISVFFPFLRRRTVIRSQRRRKKRTARFSRFQEDITVLARTSIFVRYENVCENKLCIASRSESVSRGDISVRIQS